MSVMVNIIQAFARDVIAIIFVVPVVLSLVMS